MLTSPDIVPKILDCLNWPSKGRAACVCRQWRVLAGSAEGSLSAGKCWLMWQQPWPPEGPVLRHVQKCKLALCTDRLHLVDFNWPQLPALTAMHIETVLTTTLDVGNTIYWSNETVRDLSVTVLRPKRHCLAHGEQWSHYRLALGVASSCLETLCVRAVVAETGLLACKRLDPILSHKYVGVYIDLQLVSVPQLHQLLVCSQKARVCGGQEAASLAGDRPTVSFSGLKAAFLTYVLGVKLTSGGSVWGLSQCPSVLKDMFQRQDREVDSSQLKGSLRLASDNHTMQLLQTYFEHGCCPGK